jgi:Fic family protein
MNCYYSNLIEGHHTHPVDIDRALKQEFSAEPQKRNLQREAVAHIAVQQAIDHGEDPRTEPTRRDYFLWLHREFCRRLPDDLRWVENPDTGERLRVVPGELRSRGVKVGQHVPPDPGVLPAFLARFEEVYASPDLSRVRRLMALGAAHHRLLWIHPFLDGNGRVARLMSHAQLLRLNVGSSLWSVSRGLARRVNDYKRLLMNADDTRAHEYDGRGTLSAAALVDFCRFFLETAIDQVRFMEGLLNPRGLTARMERFVDEEIGAGRLLRGSFQVLREVVLSGEVERGRAGELTGYRDRRARTVVAVLLKRGYLQSDSPRGRLRLGFPLDAVERWFPGLYPPSAPT